MKRLSEEALIGLALRKADQRAFGQLVTRHQSMVRNSLRQLTDWNEALADDLAQETFIKAYQNLQQFDGRAKFSSWLYRIAYNQFLQYCRKQNSLKRSAELEELDIEHLDSASVALAEHCLDNAQERDLQEDGLQRKVATILAGLEPKRRCVLHLFLYRECTHKEISQILQMPLGSVKTHINRGRDQLQSRLQEWQVA